MKRWKRVVFSIILLVLVIVACILSWSYGFRKGLLAGGLTREIAELTLIEKHMADQMANAGYEGAKQAIVDYLEMLGRLKGVEGAIITKTSYHADIMLCHVRLARIEKRLGNNQEAARHIQIAKRACIARNWKDCSEEKMILFSQRNERKFPIACLAGEEGAAQPDVPPDH